MHWLHSCNASLQLEVAQQIRTMNTNATTSEFVTWIRQKLLHIKISKTFENNSECINVYTGYSAVRTLSNWK